MLQKSKHQLDYTIATHAVEHLEPSKDAVSLCKQISEGKISTDAAVEKLLWMYGLKRNKSHD